MQIRGSPEAMTPAARRRAARMLALIRAGDRRRLGRGAGPGVRRSGRRRAKSDDKATQEMQLRGVEDTMRASEDQRRRIEADIETIRTDRARLNAALIDTTAKVQDTERADRSGERAADETRPTARTRCASRSSGGAG